METCSKIQITKFDWLQVDLSDWSLHQLDVNNVFLHGNLTEDVYLAQPQGYVDSTRPDYFDVIIHLVVYVDDLIVTGNNHNAIDMFIAKLGKRFSIKDLGQLAYFLGVRVIRTPKGLYLSQRKYIKDIVERASMSGAKPVSTPLVTTNNLGLEDSAHLSDSKDYQFFVGCLQYLALTPPDIAFVTNRLAQFSHRPTTNHLVSLKRMICYLAGTMDKRIYFSKESPLVLHAFSNPDWAEIVMIVAHSSTEADV
ncbi:hypothetical protein KY290_013545 [Solanum tuberosum]|uniref:Reverse transcriptase Ty1/copia-type domain-containing protein n=1 Tax=Solanum tuberosum TaxID=4113 RepID=A0ABQ7VM22_SOLTU|nr:hypothetical protein KY285_013011 [Solanum tuberosum]KAH0769564.1 hypothetical protein KY290_013545 [Solanum tuberosum]